MLLPPEKFWGKLAIYANKPDGITKSLVDRKEFEQPSGCIGVNNHEGSKGSVKNGRKALACTKDSESEYKDGSLPSGQTIADYHRYIREQMYLELRGGTGAATTDNADDVYSLCPIFIAKN